MRVKLLRISFVFILLVPQILFSENFPLENVELKAALRAVVTLNPEIKSKESEIEAKEYDLASAKASRYPTLTGSVNDLDEEGERGSLRLQQPIWSFGKISNEIKIAEALLQKESWILLDLQRSLIRQTSIAYANVHSAEEQIKVAFRNFQEHERLHSRVERRHQGKLSSEADVRLAYSRLVQAEAKYVRIKGQKKLAIIALERLTQKSIDTYQNINIDSLNLPEPSELEKIAFENSARIFALEIELESEKFKIKQVKASVLPDVYFRMERDVLKTDDIADKERSGFVIESTIGGLGFISRGRIKSAISRLYAVEFNVVSARNDLKREIADLMINHEIQQQLIDSQYKALIAVSATMESFERQYNAGRKSWVEVLNTQRELSEIEFQLIQYKNEWLTTSLSIAAIVGSLDEMAGLQTL